MSSSASTMAGPASQSAPAYVRIKDGTSGNLAAISAVGALSVSASGDTATNSDAVPVRSVANVAQTIALLNGYNGASYDRIRTHTAVGDGLGTVQAMQPSSGYVYASAAANTAVTATIAAVAGQTHRLTYASIVYTGTVSGAGAAVVTDNASTVFQWNGAVVPFALPLPPGGLKCNAVNTSLTGTLFAGGLSAIGNVTIGKVTA